MIALRIIQRRAEDFAAARACVASSPPVFHAPREACGLQPEVTDRRVS